MLKLKDVKNKLKNDLTKLTSDRKIEIKSFKKDRLLICTKENETFLIVEKGFQTKEYSLIEMKETEKLLNKLIDFEFPRSTNLWYSFKNK